MKNIRIRNIILFLFIVIGLLGFNNFAAAKEITLKVNGELVITDTAPEIKNGRTFIPLRAMFEAIGMEVEWAEDDRTARAYNKVEDLYVGLTVGVVSSTVGNRNKIMEEPAYISNSRVMVPVRFIGESLGYEVEWEADTREINMTKEDMGIASTDGITVLIDGKKSDISNYTRFYDGGDNYIYGTVTIAPLKMLVKELYEKANVEIIDNEVVLTTNYDVFVGEVNTYMLMGHYTLPDPSNSSKRQWFIDGEYFMDVEYITKLLKGEYSYDENSKTIYIVTEDKRLGIPNEGEAILKVANLEELAVEMEDFYINHTEPVDKLKVYFENPLKREYLIREEFGNNPIDKIIIDKEFGHLTGNYMSCLPSWDTSGGIIHYDVEYDTFPGTEEIVLFKINKTAKELVNKLINTQMTTRQKVEVLSNYISDNTSYDYDLYNNKVSDESEISFGYSASGVLFNGKAVCAGYAEALNILLYFAGMDSKVLSGEANNGDHAWVIVNIDGEWLHVDPTWNSTLNDNSAYMLKTDSEMRQTHKWE